MRVTIKYRVEPGYITQDDCDFAAKWLGGESQVILGGKDYLTLEPNQLVVTQVCHGPHPEIELGQALIQVKTILGKLALLTFESCAIS